MRLTNKKIETARYELCQAFLFNLHIPIGLILQGGWQSTVPEDLRSPLFRTHRVRLARNLRFPSSKHAAQILHRRLSSSNVLPALFLT